MLAANDEMAQNGYRVLAVATRCLPPDLPDFAPDTVEAELTLLGLVGIIGPREEVMHAPSRFAARPVFASS